MTSIFAIKQFLRFFWQSNFTSANFTTVLCLNFFLTLHEVHKTECCPQTTLSSRMHHSWKHYLQYYQDVMGKTPWKTLTSYIKRETNSWRIFICKRCLVLWCLVLCTQRMSRNIWDIVLSHHSLEERVAERWKRLDLEPTYIKGNINIAPNYSPVSLTLMEKEIRKITAKKTLLKKKHGIRGIWYSIMNFLFLFIFLPIECGVS